MERRTGQFRGRLLGRDEVGLAIRLYREASFNQLTAEQWDWRFFQRNPELAFVSGVFTPEGRLIALNPMTVRPVWILGREQLAAQACDTLVHSDYRGGGRVYAFLMRFGFDMLWAYGMHFGFGGGATAEAAAVGKRLGNYHSLFDMAVYERRLSLRLALGRRAGAAGGAAAKLLDGLRPHRRLQRHGGLEIRAAAQAGPEFDRLWQRKRERYTVVLRRDARELRWRWFENPVPSEMLAAWRGGELEGYIVLRHHPDPGGPARLTTVLDLFTGLEPEVDEALLAAAARVARASGSDFLHYAACPGASAAALLRRAPWRPARKQVDRVVTAPYPYAARDSAVLPEFDAAMHGQNWYYCQGDSDFLD